MPELPEVETTVRGLKREVLNRTFLDFSTDTPKIVKGIETQEFKDSIVGKTIIDVKRRAKNILIFLNSDSVILIHLKMTGHLLIGDWEYDKKNSEWVPLIKGPMSDDPYNRFVRVVFCLNDGRKLALCDMRKFAKIELLKKSEVENGNAFKEVGPEPLDDSFSLEDLVVLFKNKKRGKIKQVLMDQSFIAGIGNIYANEILFEVKINPEEDVSSLNENDIKNIYSAMKSILEKAIESQGDSFSDFRNIYGERGKFQNFAKAYGKDGENCQNCGNIIIKSKVGGRGTFYCPKCQMLRK